MRSTNMIFTIEQICMQGFGEQEKFIKTSVLDAKNQLRIV